MVSLAPCITAERDEPDALAATLLCRRVQVETSLLFDCVAELFEIDYRYLGYIAV